jgi:GT2 family glycosyltransferase
MHSGCILNGKPLPSFIPKLHHNCLYCRIKIFWKNNLMKMSAHAHESRVLSQFWLFFHGSGTRLALTGLEIVGPVFLRTTSLAMGKVIAFDRNRVRSRTQTRAYAEGLRSRAGVRAGHQVHPFPLKKEDISVSVIVSAGSQPHLLSHCLASLLFQQFEPSRYEIIVVEDDLNPATRDIVNDWAKHVSRTGPTVSYIAGHGGCGMAAARNRGWRAARGTIVAFTEADVVARPDWLQKGLHAFGGSVQAVWGRIATPNTLREAGNEFPCTLLEPESGFASNYFVRKVRMEEMGGFDERFRHAWGEETDLYFRLCSYPSRVVHDPHAIVTHPSRRTGLGISLAGQRRYQADVLLYKKHPQLYRQKIRGTPHWETYLIVATLLLAAACALAGASVLATGSAALWGILTLRVWKRQWRAANYALSRCVETFCAALLLPPLETFWHTLGLLRFRRTSP